MTRTLIYFLACFVLVAAAVQSAVCGDTVQTADGRVLNGTVTFNDGRVLVQPPIGMAQTLDPADVLTIDIDAQAVHPRDGLPPPWSSRDIGKVGLNGKATHHNGTFHVTGAGADIWEKEDAFHFVQQPVGRTTEITARVLSIQNTHEHAKAGVMIRAGLRDNARYVMLLVKPTGEVALERRTSGSSELIKRDRVKIPVWLRLQQRNEDWRAQFSEDGQTWTTLATMRVDLESAHAGLAVLSHDTSRLCTARFDQVDIRGAVDAAEVPVVEQIVLNAGVVLRDGRVISGEYRSMSDELVRIKRADDTELNIPMLEVACIVLQPLTDVMTGQVLRNRSGVLMKNGDFLEGEVSILQSDRIRVNSILYGLQTVSRNTVAMIVMSAAAEPDAPVVIRLADGSVWVSSQLDIQRDRLVIDDPLAGEVKLEARQIQSITAVRRRTTSLLALQPNASERGIVVGSRVAVDRSVTGYPLRIAGRSVATGLGSAGNVELNFTLDRPYRALLCTAGIASEQAPLLRAHLVILGDGKELYRSPPIGAGDPALPIGVSLAGVKTLTLSVRAADGQALCPAGVWATPLLVIE